QHRGQIAGARLRRLAIGFDGAADATPHIELPEGGEAHAVLGAHGAAGGRGAPRGAGAAAGGGRILAAGRGDIGGNGRKVARASRAEERGRLLVPGRREQHVLIGDLHLPLESVEVRIAVELPPLAARRQLLRLGRLPVLALLVGRRHLQARAMVGGPDRQVPAAAGGAEREQCRDAWKRAPHATPSSGFGKRCRRDLAHSRKRSRYRYITGVVYRVNTWLRRRPPSTAMPSGRRSSAPSPKPIASGSAPNIAAMVVMSMGRSRRRHAS